MTLTGGCHCGAVRYEVEGDTLAHTLCHCNDCRRSAGAPMVGWAVFPREAVKVTQGEPKLYRSSEHARRYFCPDCGTGLFYENEHIWPGVIDIQSATYDDPEASPPQAHIQLPERLEWMEHAHELPSFERFPPLD